MRNRRRTDCACSENPLRAGRTCYLTNGDGVSCHRTVRDACGCDGFLNPVFIECPDGTSSAGFPRKRSRESPQPESRPIRLRWFDRCRRALAPVRAADAWAGDHFEYEHCLDVVLLLVSIIGLWLTKFVFDQGGFAATTAAFRTFRWAHRFAIIPLFVVLSHDLIPFIGPVYSLSITLLSMAAFQGIRVLLRTLSPEPNPSLKPRRKTTKSSSRAVAYELPTHSRRRKKS